MPEGTAPATTGTNGGTAPTTTHTAPPPATTAPIVGTTGTTPPATTTDWKTGLSDDLRQYIDTKGFKDPGTLADGYRNLERLRGVPSERLVTVPDRHDDEPGWTAAFNRMGRPEKADGYNIPITDDSQKAYVAEVQKIFHESGLTVRQAEILNTKMNQYVETQKTVQTTAQQTQATQEESALKGEWGVAFDQNINLGRQAAKTFGLTTEKIDAIQKVLGFKDTVKLFHQIGSKLGEADFVTGQGPDGKGALTPDQAKGKIEQKKVDTNFWKRYLDGEGSAMEEMEQLHKWAFPEPTV